LACGDSTGTHHTRVASPYATLCRSPAITFTDTPTAANCTGQGGIDRQWKATDACGNHSECVQHISFADTTPPQISCPADKVLACGDSTATNNTAVATATDNCAAAVVITFTDTPTAANCTGQGGI